MAWSAKVIYLGEEAGLGQWADALGHTAQRFGVHVPPHLMSTFSAHGPESNDRLNLTLSLRTHRAERERQDWVAAVIEGRIDDAAELAPKLHGEGFDLYVTNNLLKAKRYVLARYEDAPEKRFGLLASSKARNLRSLGIDNEYQATLRLRVGQWFNAPPSDPRSSCQLTQPVTEFQCQGLELDMPIICWGDDLGWTERGWESYRQTRQARDSHQLRLNSYRVLLTRGRDGMIVFVPDNLRHGQSESGVGLLVQAGAAQL